MAGEADTCQLQLPQQWSNLRYTGRIYVILRYNKSARIFWFEQLLFNKVDFGASNFEAALQLQIEAEQKMLGWSVAFGVKSVEKQLLGQILDDPYFALCFR